MKDSLDVEEIVEHIRQRARARLEGKDNRHIDEGSTPLSQRLRRIWQLLKWYSQHPEEFHSTITSRLVTARSLDELKLVVDNVAERLDDVRKILMASDHRGAARAAAGLEFNDPVLVRYDAAGRAFWDRTNERIVEKAWVLRNIGLNIGAKILDAGCAESLLGIELASNGFSVTGLDFRPYPLEHPNFRFIQGDLEDIPLASESFDGATLLSTIEHVGLGWYGDPQGASKRDAAMAEIHRVLKPGGRLLLTVPFGNAAMTPLHHIFDPQELRRLVRRFRILSLEYGIKLDKKTWLMPATEEQAAAQTHDAETFLPGAVALAICEKMPQ